MSISHPNPKVAKFLTTLVGGEYEVPEPFLNFIITSLTEAGLDQTLSSPVQTPLVLKKKISPITVTIKSPNPDSSLVSETKNSVSETKDSVSENKVPCHPIVTIKRENHVVSPGYNSYLQFKIAGLKASGEPINLKTVHETWNSMSKTHKAEWEVQERSHMSPPVQTIPVVAAAAAVPSASTLKKRGPKSMTSYQLFVKEIMPHVKATFEKDHLKEVGRLWSLKTSSEKLDYKHRADELSGVVS